MSEMHGCGKAGCDHRTEVAPSYVELEEQSDEALKQILGKQYETDLARDG